MLLRRGGPGEVGAAAADLVAGALAAGARTLGLATGSSPQPLYRELARRVAAGELSFAGCSAYLLDEYVGLPDGHAQAYAQVIRRDLVDHVDLDPASVHGPDGSASDLDAEAERYEEAVVGAGVDLQVLGIGVNGHIGFNEPGSPLDATTRVVRLAEQTRRDNARFFGSLDAVPETVLTQGPATILRASRLVLVVSGARKAAALTAALTGPVTVDCPASVLQRHPDVVVIADDAAAAGLTPGR